MEAIDRPWWALRSEAATERRDAELATLFERLADDELEAMTELYDGWSDELFGFAVWASGDRQHAGEIVQEVLLKLWRLRRRLGHVRRPRPYLLRMVRNLATDHHRRTPPPADPLEENLLEPVLSDPTRAIAARRASRALLELSEVQRTAVYLHLYADLTFREIGDLTGVSTHTAASRYRLGIERLRKRFEEDG